jgi:hypothetical protein
MDTVDLARIRFVTTRHGELQGLRQLVMLPACLVSFWSRPYIEMLRDRGSFEAVAGLLLSILPWLAVISARPALDRYYSRRFGSVDRGWSRDTIGTVVLLMAAMWIDLARLDTGRPIAVLVAGALIALHIVVKDWPWRAHHVVTAVVCASAAFLITTESVFRVDSLDEFLRGPFSVLIGAQLVSACLDHRLLMRTLPLNPDAHAGELASDHADTV